MDRIRVKVIKHGRKKYLQMRYEDNFGQVHQKSTGETTRRAAERKAADWERELNANLPAGDGRMPWNAFRAEYAEKALPGMAKRSQDRIHGVLNGLEDMIRPGKLSDITPAAIRSWFAKMRAAGRAETTIQTYGGALRAALQFAVDCEWIAEVPKFPKVRRAKTGSKGKLMKGRPITEEEFSRILDVAGDAWRPYLRGLWLSGLRLEESLILSWEPGGGFWIDFSGEFPMFRIDAEAEKGNRDRLLPMTPDFAEFLQRFPDRSGFVFDIPKQRRRQVRRGDWVSRRISGFGQDAGVIVDEKTGKYASAHDFRRSFGERWARRVMPQVLMELMRHESIETTMRFYVGKNANATAAEIWKIYKDG